MKESVIALVILYNFDSSVVNNINSYYKCVDEVLLVDNSDNNTYYNKLKDKLSQCSYISMNGNKGIATALNRGLEYAQSKKYDWALTMDQDSFFSTNIIREYFDVLEREKNDSIIILSPNYLFDRKKFKSYKGTKKIKYTMQSGNLLNIKLHNENGKFKDDFFIDCVDYEYCLRANKNGYKIIEVGTAVLKHSPAKTKKIFGLKYGICSPLRIYYQVRNLLWTSREYNCLKLKMIVYYKLFKILFLFGNKKEYISKFIWAVKDYNRNIFGEYNHG